ATLDEVIGQVAAVNQLRIAIRAAKIEGRPLDHILFSGPPGLGKSTLAQAVAAEMGQRLHMAAGAGLRELPVLLGLITHLEGGDLVFFDEIHALDPKLGEILYEALEDGRLSLPIIAGRETRTLVLELPRFTLIGATTDPDRMRKPLFARFGIHAELDYYKEDELVRVIEAAAVRLGTPVARPAAAILARASLGTPRSALRLLRSARTLVVAQWRHL